MSHSNDGTGDVVITSNHNGTFNVIGKHDYTAPPGTAYGTYPYNFDGAMVFVQSGSEVAWNKPRIVLQQPKLTAVTGLNFSGSAGKALTNQHVATFVDSDGFSGNTGAYRATINWGDGTAPDTATVITYDGNGKYTVTGEHHVYAKGGVYTVKTTIFHGSAAFTVTATGTATVSTAGASNLPQNAIFQLPSSSDSTGVSAATAHTLPSGLVPPTGTATGSGALLANDAVHIRAAHHNPALDLFENTDPFSGL